jgi:2-methylisocitrate lyase-like PEP mutase family enzyme
MVASAVAIPIIADADDGYGNALTTQRTVQEYVKTGVAGIHFEEQVFPKRCGHIAGRPSSGVRSDREISRRGRYAQSTRSRVRSDRPHGRLRRRR